jgi:hypothetical protein
VDSFLFTLAWVAGANHQGRAIGNRGLFRRERTADWRAVEWPSHRTYPRRDLRNIEVALSPLLKARPAIAEELSETLASLQLANRAVLGRCDHKEPHEGGLADRVAANIRRLFSLH